MTPASKSLLLIMSLVGFGFMYAWMDWTKVHIAENKPFLVPTPTGNMQINPWFAFDVFYFGSLGLFLLVIALLWRRRR